MMKLFEKQKLKNLTNENEVHHFVESLKLTFADREMYFTGQKKPQVTAHHLLNNQYLNKRLKLISRKAINRVIIYSKCSIIHYIVIISSDEVG